MNRRQTLSIIPFTAVQGM